jgi:hypothetical protein
MGRSKAPKAEMPEAEGVPNMQLSAQVRKTGCMMAINVSGAMA